MSSYSKELLHISAVSTYWREFSSTQNLWRPLVEELWKDKVYIHPRIRQLANINAKLAFYISIADSKRYFMTHEEVISFTFSFRFKEAAGAEWTDLCPWNDGEEASKVSFNADGTAHRIPSDRLDSTRHMALEAMYSGFRMNWVLRRRQRSLRKNSRLLFYFALQQLVEACLTQGRNAIYFGCHRLHNDSFVEPAFTTGLPSDLTPSPKLKQPRTSNMHTPSSQYRRRRASEEVGCLSSQSEFNWLTVFSHYASAASPSDDFLHTIGENLQLLINGVLVPVYHINRSPTGNWGFTMESCWAYYTSWPMPMKGECLLLEDEQLEVTVMSQWLDVQMYNHEISEASAEEGNAF